MDSPTEKAASESPAPGRPHSSDAGSATARLVARVALRERWVRAATRALWLLGAAPLAAAALTLLAQVAPSTARALASALIWTAAAAGGLWIILALRARADELAGAARHLGSRLPEVGYDLLAAVELRGSRGGASRGSTELTAAFLREMDARVAPLRPWRLVRRRALALAAGAALLSLAATSAAVALASKGLRDAWALLSERTDVPPSLSREPITGDFELEYRYPAHTGREPRRLSGSSGDIEAPPGTEVLLTTRADRAVGGAALVVNGERVPLAVSERTLRGSFVVSKPGQYRILFLDGERIVAESPDIPIRVEDDKAPVVRLLAPADGVEVLPDDPSVTVRYEAHDDYGLQALRLVFQPDGEPERRVELRSAEGVRASGDYKWELGALGLQPGRAVRYYVEASDNDTVSGPKRGVSPTQSLSLYSESEHRMRALARAERLWERLVTHYADRLEGGERASGGLSAGAPAPRAVDERARALAEELIALARALGEERHPPETLLAALGTIGVELRADTTRIVEHRKVLERYSGANQNVEREAGARLVAGVGADIRHAEKNVLYLEHLLDRERLERLHELAEALRADRRELSRLVESFSKNPNEDARAALLRRVAAIRERMVELQRRMSELAKGIRDSHVNSEALRDALEERDLTSRLDALERLVREGATEDALKQLQSLASEMDELLEGIDEGARDADENADPELAARFEAFRRELDSVTTEQERLAGATKALRDASRAEVRERLRRSGEALRTQLLRDVERLRRAYDTVDPSSLRGQELGARADVLERLAQTRRALDEGDFELAAEAATPGAERADALAESVEARAKTQALLEQLEAQRSRPGGAEQGTSKALRSTSERARENARALDAVADRLRALFEQSPGRSAAERQRLAELEQRQQRITRSAESLKRSMDRVDERAPVFDDEAREQLRQAGERMEASADNLGAGESGRSYEAQRGAIQSLDGLRSQLAKQQRQGRGRGGLPLPVSAGGGRGRGGLPSDAKVELPPEDANRAAREFRQDVMDAMRQGAPERYKEQNRRYYEELVR